ncbi:MAG: hypothetical protein A2096_14825 [Spirochaetes bacterium GWF1_41_5]|nr:MAG: hypothetical protein A2096_14825 [Spirochaetes bacterium GWF1_41_5]HBE03421.1 hypothetical protein [Spirochaetia bacterium]
MIKKEIRVFIKIRKIILIAIIAGAGVLLLVIGGLFVSMEYYVRKNIIYAEQKYSINGENALIAFVLDESAPAKDRTRIAVWTLGRMRSKKALPAFLSLYKNDPEGHTCKGRHNVVVCQYELYKAIKRIPPGVTTNNP